MTDQRESPGPPGFVVRLLADILDCYAIGVFVVPIATAASLAFSFTGMGSASGLLSPVVPAALMVWFVYEAGYLASRKGTTPGKRYFRLRVVANSGDRLPPRYSALRCLAKILSVLCLGIPFWIAWARGDTRPFHDRAGHSRIRYDDRGPLPREVLRARALFPLSLLSVTLLLWFLR